MPRFVDFLALQHPNNNVHNLRVVRLLVAGGALPPGQLLATGAVDKVDMLSSGFAGCFASAFQHANCEVRNSRFLLEDGHSWHGVGWWRQGVAACFGAMFPA